eukprot:Clim_evm28s207 gene=Clim_evmTU28s207
MKPGGRPPASGNKKAKPTKSMKEKRLQKRKYVKPTYAPLQRMQEKAKGHQLRVRKQYAKMLKKEGKPDPVIAIPQDTDLHDEDEDVRLFSRPSTKREPERDLQEPHEDEETQAEKNDTKADKRRHAIDKSKSGTKSRFAKERQEYLRQQREKEEARKQKVKEREEREKKRQASMKHRAQVREKLTSKNKRGQIKLSNHAEVLLEKIKKKFG